MLILAGGKTSATETKPLINDTVQLLGQEVYMQGTCCLTVTLERRAELDMSGASGKADHGN